MTLQPKIKTKTLEKFGIEIVNRALNVRAREWPRIIYAWMMRFLYRTGFVIGWTLIIALFVTYYGISALPYLFIIQGSFILMGSFFYSILLDRYEHKKIMLGTLFFACAFLLFSLVFVETNQVVFLSLLLVSVSIFLGQLRILLVGFVEEMFTPRESERAFPLVEASETFGGVVAGLSITLLVSVIPTYYFVYIWVLCLALLFLMIAFSDLVVSNYIVHKGGGDDDEDIIKKVKEAFNSISHGKFIKGLFLIVFFNWLLFNLLEFQYTKAVYDNLSEVIVESGTGFENIFIHDLGILFAIFNAVALLVQLFLASRLIKFLGVIGSMILHPIVTFLSILGISFDFNFQTAVLMKTNFTVTTMLHHDAYHSSYYAVKRRLRSYIHELSEGVVRPLGAICGTLVLLLLQFLFPENSSLIFALNVSMLIVAALLFFFTLREQEIYTSSALHDLMNDDDKDAQLEAVDILSAKGHRSALPILRDILKDESRPLSLRLRILEALGDQQDLDLIGDIIDCFQSPRSSMRSMALDVLLNFHKLGKETAKNLFFEVKLVNALKELYRREEKEELSSKIIILMAKISPVIAFDFILDILERGDQAMKPHAIYALGSYQSEEITEYLRPYLDSDSADIQANAAVALGRFKDLRDAVEVVLTDLLDSGDAKKIVSALYAIGELNFIGRTGDCLEFLEVENLNVRMASAFALLKLGDKAAIKSMEEFLFEGSPELSWRVQTMLSNMKGRLVNKIIRLVRKTAYGKIKTIVKNIDTFTDLDLDQLIELRRLYCLVELFTEVESIDVIIEQNNY